MKLTKEMEAHARKEFNDHEKLHTYSKFGVEESTVVCPACGTKASVVHPEYGDTIDTDYGNFTENEEGGRCNACKRRFTPEECHMLAEIGLSKDWVMMARKFPERVFVIGGTFFKINNNPYNKIYEDESKNVTIQLKNGKTVTTKSCYLDTVRLNPILRCVVPNTAAFVEKPDAEYWHRTNSDRMRDCILHNAKKRRKWFVQRAENLANAHMADVHTAQLSL